MHPTYLTHLSYRDRGRPLLGTLATSVFCDTALLVMVFASLNLAESGNLFLLLASFIFPFLIFAASGAAIADRMPKRGAIILGKTAEFATMLFAAFSFYKGGDPFLIFGITFLTGITAALLLPSFNGIISETFSEKNLSKAVGDTLCTGFIAGITGVIYVFLFVAFIFHFTLAEAPGLWQKSHSFAIIVPVCITAFFGLICSYRIYPTAMEADREAQLRRAKIFSLKDGIQELMLSKSRAVSDLGATFFFLLFALVELLFLCTFRESQRWVELTESGQPLIFEAFFPGVIFALALAVGFSFCGRLSAGKVECGLVPFGALGLAVFLPLAAWIPGPVISCHGFFHISWGSDILQEDFQFYPLQILWLLLAGFFAGLIPVPIRTYLHKRVAPEARGAAFATSNAILFLLLAILFLREDFFGKMIRSGYNLPLLLAVAGFIPLFLTIIAGFFLPWMPIRSAAVLLTHTFYRLSVKGAENIPEKGGVLLIANHSSYADSLLLLACTSRQIRFLIHEKFYRNPLIHPFAKMLGSIEVPARGKHRIGKMVNKIRQALQNGDVVCVFPEGRVSRNGVMGNFKAGYAKMLPDDCDVPIVPVSVGHVWGSLFSNYSAKRYKFFHPARVSFGEPMKRTDIDTAFCLRQAISVLETEASMEPLKTEKTIHYLFAKKAKRYPFRKVFCDYNGEEVPMFRTLLSAVLLSREIRKISGNSRYVGLMLPNSVSMATGILAVLMADKVPVPLNYTVSKDILRRSLDKAEISTVLTNRSFLKKINMELIPEMTMLEDLQSGISLSSKILWTLACVILPHQELMTYVSPRTHRDVEYTAVLLFSSGSTGQPKGIMLSHHNINADVNSFVRALGWTEKDQIPGTLPLFHSFGFTTSFWLPAMVGSKTVYVPSPLDCSAIEAASLRHNLTIILATPTFMAAYLRRCSEKVFEHLRFAIVGAEKLRKDISLRFAEVTRGKASLLEAYGCTELSPIVTVNIGRDLLRAGKKCGKDGSIGVAMPGISVRIIDPVTREELPPGMDGLLLVKGPVVMQGYIADPVRTANVISDGWYETGDIGHMDPDGYITLSGRISRFSKIAGEMVPHELLECIMGEIIGRDERVFAVGSIPDPVKGEALVVIYLKDKMNVSPEEMNDFLRKHNIPNLWIPKAANYRAVDVLPVTGTGKLDLFSLNEFIKKEFDI